MALDTSRTVRDLAVEIPHATRVFEQLGIDYCCGGKLSLAQACENRKLSVDQVLDSLEHPAVLPQSESKEDWSNAKLRALIQHIVSTHHVYVKQELPRLNALLNKIATKHGPHHPELVTVQQTFEALGQELESHMFKEENILFPYVLTLEGAVNMGSQPRRPMFGRVENPIRMMEHEHDSAGEALKTLREVTSGYTLPEDACTSYQAAYRALKDFETDLHQHIHLENNILFPQAIELEEKAFAV